MPGTQKEPNGHPPRKRIAYLLGLYPFLATTFIDREILEAKRRGLDLTLVAIRRPGPFQMKPEVQKLAGETRYILPVPWPGFLAANLYFALSRPGRYFSTLFYLLTRPHHSLAAWLKTLLHFGEGVRAADLLRAERIDHIHAHFADRAALVALVASRLLGVGYSLTAHANDIYVAPVLLSEKMQQARFVTTCTGYNKTHLEKKTGRPVELIYHGLDLAGLDPARSAAGNGSTPLILSVGQLKEKKGFPYLLRACDILRQQGYDFKCEIIGDGPDRASLQALVAELGLQDRVTLRGALPNVEVMARYPQAALFALPCVIAASADRDGIPNVVLEAMAFGLPVVSTNISGIPEVVEDGVTGLLVTSGNVEALAAAIARLLDDPDLRQRLAAAGRRRVEECFDIRKNIGRLVQLLEAA